MDAAHAAVESFRASAERFVALVDTCVTGPDENDEGIARLGVQLADLYARATQIHDVELPARDIDVAGDPSMDTTDRFFAVLTRLEQVIGATFDWGWLKQMHEIERADVAWELANDLAEVYHDVVNYLAQIANGERDGDAAWRSAVWEVRHGWWFHTGHHAVSAMKVMHAHLDVIGLRPSYQAHPGNIQATLGSIDTAGIDRDELVLRTRLGRHLARVARANGQDERASFRTAFQMNLDAAKRINELHVDEEAGPIPMLTEQERRYLDGFDEPP